MALIQSLGAALMLASIWLRLCDRNNEFIRPVLGAGIVLFLIGGLMS